MRTNSSGGLQRCSSITNDPTTKYKTNQRTCFQLTTNKYHSIHLHLSIRSNQRKYAASQWTQAQTQTHIFYKRGSQLSTNKRTTIDAIHFHSFNMTNHDDGNNNTAAAEMGSGIG